MSHIHINGPYFKYKENNSNLKICHQSQKKDKHKHITICVTGLHCVSQTGLEWTSLSNPLALQCQIPSTTGSCHDAWLLSLLTDFEPVEKIL
jgi:hypothetical protein